MSHRAAHAPTRIPPRGPDWISLDPDALALLKERKIHDTPHADFAKNRHFDGLHGGGLDGPDKPVVIFTACPNDPPTPNPSVQDELAESAGRPDSVTVDGQAISLLGIERVADDPLLMVERARRAPSGANILMYREIHSNGLYEWGASGLFFAPNGRMNQELRLCYMAGEFWAFLEHTAQIYAGLGLDGPLTVLLSIRNSGRLVLGNYGDEVFHPSWDADKHWSFSPPDPTTGRANLQWLQAFGSAGKIAGEGAARAARDMTVHVCGAYDAGSPKCYGGGRFSWKLWKHTRREIVRGSQP